MASTNEVLIKLVADSAALVAGLNKGQDALTRFDSGVAKVRGGLVMLAGALGLGSLASMAKSAIDAADGLHDLSQRTGAAVEDLSAMRLVADQNGTSLETVAKAFKKLATNQMEASSGSKEQARMFSALGISGNSALESMIKVADTFAKMPDGIAKTDLVTRLFGKAGEELIPVLNQGSAALREQIEWAKKHGATGTDAAKRADQFNDSLAKLKFSVGALTMALVGPVVNAFNSAIGKFEESAAKGQKFNGVIKASIDLLDSLGHALLGLDKHQSNYEKGQKRLIELHAERSTLERQLKSGGAGLLQRGLFGTPDEMRQQIADINLEMDMVRKSLEAIEKAPPKKTPKAAETPDWLKADKKKTDKSILDDLFWKDVEKEQALLMRGGQTIAMAYEQQQDLIATSIREANEEFKHLALAFDADAIREERVKKITEALSAGITEKGIMPRLDVYGKANEQAEAYLKPLREQVYALEGSPEWAAILEAWNALSQATYRMSDTEAALAALGKVEADRQGRLSILSAERTAGIKGETDAHTQGLAISRDALVGMQEHIDKLQALANTGYPPAIEAMQKYKAVLIDLKNQATDKTWLDGIAQGLQDYAGKFNDTFSTVRDATVKAFKGMEDALVSLVTKGKLDFKSLASSIVADIIRIQIQQNITRPLATAMGFMMPKFWASGGIPGGSGISAYRNSVVSSPTVFPFASGIGLMGEAGPEAIMPLTRASNGDLGVKVVDDNKASSPTVNINFQVNAIDTQSAMGVIMANKSAIIGMVQGAFNKAGRVAPMIA